MNGLDSYELTQWGAYFDAKQAREEHQRQVEAERRKLQGWVDEA